MSNLASTNYDICYHNKCDDLTIGDISKWQVPEFRAHEFKPKTTKYCFIVITWNEGGRIINQLKRMADYSQLADIILADGDSNDGSTEHSFLKEQGVRTLLVTNEIGLCTATRMALAYALIQSYEGIVILDGNGKDGIEALPDFLAALEEGYDLTQGSRFMKGGFHRNTPLNRYIGIRCIFAPVLSFASGFYFSDPTPTFKAISRRFLLDKRVFPFRNEFVRFNLLLYLNYRAAKLGYKVKEMPISRVYPDDGRVPTKIHGMSVLINVFEMFKVALGCYNPSVGVMNRKSLE